MTLLSVNKRSHDERRAMVNDIKEHGGNFSIDLSRNELVGEVLDEGKYNRIVMTRGLVDWHSHPKNCETSNRCALGIPSPQDISNIVLGSLYGSLGHFVYTDEGTYLIQLRPALVNIIRCNMPKMEKYLKDLTFVSDRLHSFFLKGKFKYPRYITYWLKLMTKCGLTVHLFRGNEVPQLTIDPNAHKDTRDSHWYQKVVVPQNVVGDPGRLEQCRIKI